MLAETLAGRSVKGAGLAWIPPDNLHKYKY